jgi:hypothetical protein
MKITLKNNVIFTMLVMTTNLHKKFLKGLREKYELTANDLVEQEYKYAGGTLDVSNPQHFRYWEMILRQKPNLKKPSYQRKCICDHEIINNCYIINKEDNILVLGNCCIKKFVEKSKRTCGWCGKEHRNRKYNLCNECKVMACKICGDKKEASYYNHCRKCSEEIRKRRFERQENVERKCNGDGECFDSNRLIKLFECEYKCELKHCSECNNSIPELIKNNYKGVCMKCSMENFEYGERVYLSVPYSEKDQAKNIGCRWDTVKKKWYIRDKNDCFDYLIDRWG